MRADLAAHPARCTLAYFHHPRFSSGQAGDAAEMSSIWTDLVSSGTELVLTGHDHEYERFAPQDASGGRDDGHGTREFVVGTGGRNHMTFKAAIKPNSEVRNNTSFGFLALSLAPGGYSWRFISVPSGGFSDSGSARSSQNCGRRNLFCREALASRSFSSSAKPWPTRFSMAGRAA